MKKSLLVLAALTLVGFIACTKKEEQAPAEVAPVEAAPAEMAPEAAPAEMAPEAAPAEEGK